MASLNLLDQIAALRARIDQLERGVAIGNATVSNAKLANMAEARIKGRASGAGTGAPTDLTGTQATAILDAMVGDSGSGGTKGLAPAPASGDAAAGKYLKADGTWAVPPGTATGGGLVLVQEQVASTSATLDFTSWYSSTYDVYEIVFLNVVPASNGVDLYLRVSTDTGSTWKSGASDYAWMQQGSTPPTSNTVFGDEADAQIAVSWTGGTGMQASAADGGFSGTVRLYNPGSSASYKHFLGQGIQDSSSTGTFVSSTVHGAYLATTAIDGLRVLFSSGDITSGTVRVYGLVKT